jgi:hypothetical protein
MKSVKSIKSFRLVITALAVTAAIILCLTVSVAYCETYEPERIGLCAVVRAAQDGQVIECTARFPGNINLFAYQCGLLFDANIFEAVSVETMYFDSQADNGIPSGFENCAISDGKINYISSRYKQGKASPKGIDVLKFTLKSKKAGDSRILLTDAVACAVESGQLKYINGASVQMTASAGGVNTVFNEILAGQTLILPGYYEEIGKKDIDISGGTVIDVNYSNPGINITVENGKVICEVPFDCPEGFETVVARVNPLNPSIGDTVVKRSYYNREAGLLRFAAETFGKYALLTYKAGADDIDVSDVLFPYVAAALSKGIMSVNGDGRFEAERLVTRAEMLKMITLASGYRGKGVDCLFDDVSISDWYYPYAAAGTAMGILNGNGAFRPNDYISGREAAEFFGKSPLAGGFAAFRDETAALENIGRGYAAEILYKILIGF